MLIEKQTSIKPELNKWICFNNYELQKRKKHLLSGNMRLKLNEDSNYESLERDGIFIEEFCNNSTQIFTILPSRRIAIKNRVPEISDEQLNKLENEGFSALAIYDHLLMNPFIDESNEPVWVPRVYRILDSMEDLDPGNVQKISITFQGNEKIPDLIAYFPLPHSEVDISVQKKRKQILARYLVSQVYNYGIIRRIFSLNIHCSKVNPNKKEYAFSNPEIMDLFEQVEKQYGFHARFRSFIESFNYSRFNITANFQTNRNRPFTAKH